MNVINLEEKLSTFSQHSHLSSRSDSEIRGADLNIILLANDLDERSKAKLLALRTETDGFRVHAREIY